MVQPTRRKKTVHYKRAQLSDPSITFQDYIDKALGKKPKPSRRIESLGEEGLTRRLINSSTKRNKITFGQMIIYEQGRDQTVIEIDEGADEYPVQAIPVSDSDDGKIREVIESVLYFGVLENHIGIIQSHALRARQFEDHFLWFLGDECTGVLAPETVLTITDKPTRKAREEISKKPVKKVMLGSPLYSQAQGLEVDGVHADQKKANKTKSLSFRPAGKAFDILAAALGDEWRRDLKLEESLDEANIFVNLEVKYIRKTTESAHRMLDSIAGAMRHAEPQDVRIELEGGTVLKGQDLKLTGHLSVDHYNGIADAGDLYNQMKEWFTMGIKDGTISAD